jgi:hypothetical protein
MKTKVIYKKLDGEVIALFPEIPATQSSYDILSYMHVGQHTAASVELMSNPPAKPVEYMPLHEELILIGYDLKICKRCSYKMRLQRYKNLKN